MVSDGEERHQTRFENDDNSGLKYESDDYLTSKVEADSDSRSRPKGGDKVAFDSDHSDKPGFGEQQQIVSSGNSHQVSKSVSIEEDKPQVKARVNGKSNKRQRCAVAQEGSIPVSDLRIEFDEAKLNLLQVCKMRGHDALLSPKKRDILNKYGQIVIPLDEEAPLAGSSHAVLWSAADRPASRSAVHQIDAGVIPCRLSNPHHVPPTRMPRARFAPGYILAPRAIAPRPIRCSSAVHQPRGRPLRDTRPPGAAGPVPPSNGGPGAQGRRGAPQRGPALGPQPHRIPNGGAPPAPPPTHSLHGPGPAFASACPPRPASPPPARCRVPGPAYHPAQDASPPGPCRQPAHASSWAMPAAGPCRQQAHAAAG